MSRKTLFAAVLSFFFAHGLQATCGTTLCYDECENRYVRVEGNECERRGVWFPEESCYKARGYCNQSGSFCRGTTYCYDSCYREYILSTGDTCERYYDFDNSCWASMGVCSRSDQKSP